MEQSILNINKFKQLEIIVANYMLQNFVTNFVTNCLQLQILLHTFVTNSNNKQTNIMENKILIEEYVYERVKKNDVTINIPIEPIFFQEYNHRVMIGIFPQFATMFDNSVWELQIIKISDANIERTHIRTNVQELSNIVSRFDIKQKSNEDKLKDKVVRYLKDYYLDDKISKERFVSKYEEYLKKCSEIIN